MSKIEEVKKILRQCVTVSEREYIISDPDAKVGFLWELDVERLAKQICQLFEIPELPLLSDEELDDIIIKSKGSLNAVGVYTRQDQRDLCEKVIKGE